MENTKENQRKQRNKKSDGNPSAITGLPRSTTFDREGSPVISCVMRPHLLRTWTCHLAQRRWLTNRLRAVTRDNRALSSVKRWDSKELRMAGCVSIADSDEHTTEVAMVKFVSIFPELSEGPLGVE